MLALPGRDATVQPALNAGSAAAVFDADTLTGTDGSAVPIWWPADGIQPEPLRQPSSGLQPLLKVAATGFNGHNAVLFNAAAMDANWSPEYPSPVTVVTVIDRDRLSNGTIFSSPVGPDGLAYEKIYEAWGNPNWQHGTTAANQANFEATTAGTPTAGPYINVSVFNGASSRFYFGKKTPLTGTVGTDPALGAMMSGLRVGALYTGTPGSMNLRLAHIEVHNKALSQAEVEAVLATLAAKYGLTVGA
jgi:hypothetical protein